VFLIGFYYSDGFGSGGVTNGLYENNHIENGDDCMTVGTGANNIHFRNSYCKGGHGLSIGSLGKSGAVADVQNVLYVVFICYTSLNKLILDYRFENVVMDDSLYAARFKSWTGGNGLARNITWKNIIFNRVMFPIYVTQNYWDQGLGSPPNSSTVNNTHIQDMTFVNFAGSINEYDFVSI
jgi:polygalacturonase